LGFWVFRMQLG